LPTDSIPAKQENFPLRLATSPSFSDGITKHHAGQFEWLLSLPATASSAQKASSSGGRNLAPPEGKKLYFGCNLLSRKRSSAGGVGRSGRLTDTYTLIATPLQVDDEIIPNEPKVLVEDIMATPQAIAAHVSTPKAPDVVEAFDCRDSPLSSVMSSDQSKITVAIAPARTASSSISRIEDSVEELDKLEDELEAVDAATHFELLEKATAAGRSSTVQSVAIRGSPSTSRRPPRAAPTTVRARPAAAKRTSMIRSEGDAPSQDEKPGIKSGPRRATVSRPASLLPPKPPAKSTKAPTRSTFELPGEAVARRLKEQREARLSQQVSPEKATALAGAVASPRPKSTKTPTVPNFELPGEAISRKKKEAREQRLRQQEEELRQRREFKAKPMRNSIVPNTLPRETVASRARQAKSLQEESGTKPDTPANKRASVVHRAPLLTSAAERSPEIRGRAIGSATAQMSRATSTSTGSISGKRSTLSAEEAQQQKARGRQIYKRDNSYTEDIARERNERENAAKIAREQAAERTRQASREWAEKQRFKKLVAQSQAGTTPEPSS
jgi:uncharacterized protein YaiL (DUF2058 family)